ncbi:putative sodium-coupled neutral amino acid transporter 7 isoform X1 [Bombus pyrosoma]|uniref:putative sodium-coupled neutral amino acid transporter 7 isoform X1 n=2 Tax=Bombus pyrosoma TaxID=396416 RepID=UPI001CB99BEC|nr:putative sodium-coupled neutral amino acid transporter 7 isoform X1 [Bombus pyrosoma]XP_043590248.1 putative sodium-coupled neutral amino acid transporter 7 isoform X1 [Bombus pyrosoma]XP_043590249.1 putative sodium-coupled neutral amino acid transporter 7 isoform X1 [Bombus pyrosoma]
MNCLIGDTERLITNDMLLCTAPSPSSIPNAENARSGTSILSTIFLIVNATLGAGLLNFPQAFDRAGGLVSSINVQLVALIFITATLVILANCSDITNTCTMQDMFANFYGQKSLFLCALCIVIYSFGCCLTFLIIIGDQFDRILATYYGLDYCYTWYMSRTFVTTVTCSLFILPLCFFKGLNVLSYASSIGCITILYVIALIVYKYFTNTVYPINSMKIWPDNEYEAFQIIPIICFAYQSHMTAIPMYACMKERNLKKFTLCAIVSMIICFTAYTVVGIFGYATFGAGKVPSDILQGYADKSIILTLGIIFIAIKNFTTYPIVLYCGRDALLSLLGMDNNSIKFRVFITLIWYILSLVIAVLVPDISPVINFLGALSAAFMFIFPGICLFQSTLLKDSELHLNKDRLLIFFAIFITALGAFISGVVLTEATEDLNIKPNNSSLVSGFRQLKENLCT